MLVVGSSVVSAWWDGRYPVTQGFGPTDVQGEPNCGGVTTHRGIDVGVPQGSRIRIPASFNGQFRVNCVPVDQSGGYGNLVIVRGVVDPADSKTYDVYMAHNQAFLVSNGAMVAAGTELAITDSTGFSSGPHVHFEVRPAGKNQTCDSVDPTAMMQLSAAASQPSNVQLLNGGIDLSNIGQEIQQSVQTVESTVGDLVVGGLGMGAMGAGTIAAVLAMRGVTPAQALASASRAQQRLVPQPAPKPAPTGPKLTEAERMWAARRLRSGS